MRIFPAAVSFVHHSSTIDRKLQNNKFKLTWINNIHAHVPGRLVYQKGSKMSNTNIFLYLYKHVHYKEPLCLHFD